MKRQIVLGIAAVLAFGAMALGGIVHAQSPREQLQQMVEQLQKTPNDNVLREKIIRLAAEIKPAPAIPEEAVRRMARGAAAFKSATPAADYQDAVKEFEQATLAAPWYGDAYFNLGVAQDKAGNYEAALRSLKLAQLTSDDSKEIKALIYEVEYRNEKTQFPNTAVAAKPAGPDFSGSWVVPGKGWVFLFIEQNGDGWIVRDEKNQPLSVVKMQGRQLWVEGDTSGRGWATTHSELVLSENGQTIDVASKDTQSAEERNRFERVFPGVRMTDLDRHTRFTLRRK